MFFNFYFTSHSKKSYRALEAFANNNLNLTKIELKSIPSNPFEYFFFLDFIF